MPLLSVYGADFKSDPPLMEERSVGILQRHRRIVDVRWLSGDAVQFENFKLPALELFHGFRADVETAKVEAGKSSRDLH
jgi:hypothetical protein